MLEKVREKNNLAAILYLILFIGNLSSLFNYFSLIMMVTVIAEILLICSLYKNVRGKMIIVSTFLMAVVDACGFISFGYYALKEPINLFNWIPSMVILAGSFLFMIVAVIAITDSLPSYKVYLPKLKYAPIGLSVVGNLLNLIFLGRNSGVSFVVLLVSWCAKWLVLDWLVSSEKRSVEDGMLKVTKNIPFSLKKTMASEPNCTEELRKIKNLLDEGLITQEEYDTKKKELLGL